MIYILEDASPLILSVLEVNGSFESLYQNHDCINNVSMMHKYSSINGNHQNE